MASPAPVAAILVLFHGATPATYVITLTSEIALMAGGTKGCIARGWI